MTDFPDIRVAFGESDEYSFVFHKTSKLYGENLDRLCIALNTAGAVYLARFLRPWAFS